MQRVVQSYSPGAWKIIEHSLWCAVQSKRLIEVAYKLREKSQILRQQSSELLSANSWSQRHRQNIQTSQPSLVRKLRLREPVFPDQNRNETPPDTSI
jgi:hypothetical protein